MVLMYNKYGGQQDFRFCLSVLASSGVTDAHSNALPSYGLGDGNPGTDRQCSIHWTISLASTELLKGRKTFETEAPFMSLSSSKKITVSELALSTR